MFETVSRDINEGTELAAYSWRGLRELRPKSIELPVMSCWLDPEAYYDYVRGKGGGVYNLPPVPEEAFRSGSVYDRGLERAFLDAVEHKYGKVRVVDDFDGPEVDDEKHEFVLSNFGVIEEHGFHLPLDSDNIMIYGLIRKVLGKGFIDKLGRHIQMPSLSYGVTGPYEMDFPGTINLGPEILKRMSRNYISEIAGSLKDSSILLLTAHNDPVHRGAIESVVDEFMGGHSIGLVFDFGLLNPREFKTGGHAGRNETSVIMNYMPGVVDMNQARGGKVNREFFDERGYVDNANIGNRSGVNGYGSNHPKLSTPGFGKRYVDGMVDGIEEMLRDMQGVSG
jgi:creatinine amidohydrolase/Fe(II)-dependent formamide hydrolase-like protein